jgi:hypothetical protein
VITLSDSRIELLSGEDVVIPTTNSAEDDDWTEAEAGIVAREPKWLNGGDVHSPMHLLNVLELS